MTISKKAICLDWTQSTEGCRKRALFAERNKNWKPHLCIVGCMVLKETTSIGVSILKLYWGYKSASQKLQAMHVWPQTLPRQKSQAMLMARHMRKTRISAPADLCVFCLLGNLPSPLNHKFLVSYAPCGRLVNMEYVFISQQFYFRVVLGLYA